MHFHSGPLRDSQKGVGTSARIESRSWPERQRAETCGLSAQRAETRSHDLEARVALSLHASTRLLQRLPARVLWHRREGAAPRCAASGAWVGGGAACVLLTNGRLKRRGEEVGDKRWAEDEVGQPRHEPDGLQVEREALAYAGAHHLDDAGRAAQQPCAVHLMSNGKQSGALRFAPLKGAACTSSQARDSANQEYHWNRGNGRARDLRDAGGGHRLLVDVLEA
eukprot:6180665-Pleurochrysis_carterae.AAC.4